MTKEQATALFERVYTVLSGFMHSFTLNLMYTQEASVHGKRIWSVTIDSWNKHYELRSEETWREYKREHAVLETDEDFEEDRGSWDFDDYSDGYPS